MQNLQLVSFVYHFSIAHPRPAQKSVCLFPFPFPFSASVVSLSVSLLCIIALNGINASVCLQFVLIDWLKSAAVYPQIGFIIMHSLRPADTYAYVQAKSVVFTFTRLTFRLGDGKSDGDWGWVGCGVGAQLSEASSCWWVRMVTEHANVKTVAGIRYLIFYIWKKYTIYRVRPECLQFPRRFVKDSGGRFLWQL